MKRFEGKISQDYDLVTEALLSYFDLQEFLADRIAKQYRSPFVVDIGLGTGLTTKAIIAKNPNCFVRGLDNERTMIEQARHNLESALAKGVVEIRESDGLIDLRTVQDASVDVVASSYTLHNCLTDYRAELDLEIFRVLRPGGMFINNDKYAADDRQEYVKELAEQIVRYDILAEQGRDDLKRLWIYHEIEDQLPERIMWSKQSLEQLERVGFVGVSVIRRIGQYAVVTGFKPEHATSIP